MNTKPETPQPDPRPRTIEVASEDLLSTAFEVNTQGGTVTGTTLLANGCYLLDLQWPNTNKNNRNTHDK